MRSISVRAMTPDDIPALAEWMPTILPWMRYGLTVERTRTNLERAMRQQHILLTAEVDGDELPAGLAWCISDGAFNLSPYLRWLAARPDLSGAGIGSALLAATERASAAYRPDLFLLAADFNEGAHRFYERHGYRQVGALADYVVSGVTELLYWKRLIEAKTAGGT